MSNCTCNYYSTKSRLKTSHYYARKQRAGRSASKMTKYQAKLLDLKKLIRRLAYENAALCDAAAQVQETILIVKEERRFLLKKLAQFEPNIELELLSQKHSSSHSTNSNEPKRKKKSDNPDKSKSRKPTSRVRKKIVQPIPLDSSGRPVFPIELGGLTVHSLGDVVHEKSEFHTEDVIYPVGYVSTRVYGSLKDPRSKCVYTCKISDDNGVPRFDIVADNDLNTPIVGTSPDMCHSLLLQHINKSLGMNVLNTRARGNEFFGLSHPTILNLIQSSPGTRKCGNYKWSRFEVVRNPEVNVEENDASLSFDSLQRSIDYCKFQAPEIKEEPSDELIDGSNGPLRGLLMS